MMMTSISHKAMTSRVQMHPLSMKRVVVRTAFGKKQNGDHDNVCDDEEKDASKIAEAIINMRDQFSISRNKIETDRIYNVAEIVNYLRTLSKKEIMFVRSVIDEHCCSKNNNIDENDKFDH
jgi:hypothetical protein